MESREYVDKSKHGEWTSFGITANRNLWMQTRDMIIDCIYVWKPASFLLHCHI